MAIDQSAKPGNPTEHEASFKAFTAACTKQNLLSRPESLESRDLCDGLSDPPTLLYAPQAIRLTFRRC